MPISSERACPALTRHGAALPNRALDHRRDPPHTCKADSTNPASSTPRMFSNQVILSQTDRWGKDFRQDERRPQAGFAAQQSLDPRELHAGTNPRPLDRADLLANALWHSSALRGRQLDFRRRSLGLTVSFPVRWACRDTGHPRAWAGFNRLGRYRRRTWPGRARLGETYRRHGADRRPFRPRRLGDASRRGRLWARCRSAGPRRAALLALLLLLLHLSEYAPDRAQGQKNQPNPDLRVEITAVAQE
jgi:hypothetical protein